MKKDKNPKEELEIENETKIENEVCCGDSNSSAEVEELQKKLDEKCKQYEDCLALAQRTAAEFENYKKRTQKEKEAIYLDASANTVCAFLPVVDNLERALKAVENEENNPLKDGVEMVMRQLNECLEKMGVEAIPAVGNNFDPELHNAVMHINDDEQGENLVIEEFQKGYTIKGKVVRHSMVKVVN